MLTGFGTWLTLNETDAQWVTDIARPFREAGAGTVSDAVIAATPARGRARRSAGCRSPTTTHRPGRCRPRSGYADDPVNTGHRQLRRGRDRPGRQRPAPGCCASPAPTTAAPTASGPFGPGWASWATARLRAEPDGAHWEAPDGQRAVFPRSPRPANGDGNGGGSVPPPFAAGTRRRRRGRPGRRRAGLELVRAAAGWRSTPTACRCWPTTGPAPRSRSPRRRPPGRPDPRRRAVPGVRLGRPANASWASVPATGGR